MENDQILNRLASLKKNLKPDTLVFANWSKNRPTSARQCYESAEPFRCCRSSWIKPMPNPRRMKIQSQPPAEAADLNPSTRTLLGPPSKIVQGICARRVKRPEIFHCPAQSFKLRTVASVAVASSLAEWSAI